MQLSDFQQKLCLFLSQHHSFATQAALNGRTTPPAQSYYGSQKEI
jgi:hypothetical protein